MHLILFALVFYFLPHVTDNKTLELNFDTLDNRLEDLQVQIGPYPILDISSAVPQRNYFDRNCNVTQPKLVSPAELFLGFYNQFCPQNDTFCKTLSPNPIHYDSWTVMVGKEHVLANSVYFNVFGPDPFDFYQSRLELPELTGLKIEQIQFFARGVDDLIVSERQYSISMVDFQIGLKLETEDFVRVIRIGRDRKSTDEPYDNTIDIEAQGWVLPTPQQPSTASNYSKVNLPPFRGQRPSTSYVRVAIPDLTPIFSYESLQNDNQSTILTTSRNTTLVLPLTSMCHLRSTTATVWNQTAPKFNFTNPDMISYMVEDSFHVVGLQKVVGTALDSNPDVINNRTIVAKVQLCKVFVVKLTLKSKETQTSMESVCRTIEHLVTNGSNQTGQLTNNTSSRGVDMIQDGRGGCVAVANQLVTTNNSTKVVTTSAFWVSYTNETTSRSLTKTSEHFAGVSIMDVTPETQSAEILSAVETRDFLIIGYGGSDYELVYRPNTYTARLKQSKKHFGKILFFAHDYHTRLTEVRPVVMISAGSKQSSPHAPVMQSNETFVRQLHADTINSLSSIISCSLDRKLLGKRVVFYYKVYTPFRDFDLQISFGFDSKESHLPLLLRVLQILFVIGVAATLVVVLLCFLLKWRGSAGVKATIDQVLQQKPSLSIPESQHEHEEIHPSDSSHVMDSQRTADLDVHTPEKPKEQANFDPEYKFPVDGLRTPDSAQSQKRYEFDSA